MGYLFFFLYIDIIIPREYLICRRLKTFKVYGVSYFPINVDTVVNGYKLAK